MQQRFVADRNVYLDLAPDGSVRNLRHLDAPFSSHASTPQLVVADYLNSFADLLQIGPAELSSLGASPSTSPEQAAVQFRYGGEKAQFDSTTVAYEQTVRRAAGLRCRADRTDAQPPRTRCRVRSRPGTPTSTCSPRNPTS